MIASFAFAVTVGVLPELLLVGGAGICLALLALRPRLPHSIHRWVSCMVLAGAVAASLITLYGLRLAPTGVGLVAFGGGLVVDRFAELGAVMVELLALLTVLAAGSVVHRGPGSRVAVFHALVLVATAAAALLSAEREMVAIVVTAQLLVTGITLLGTLWRTDGRAVEASMKRVVLAAAAAAALLYGFAILFGVSGSTDLAALSRGAYSPALVGMGTLLVLAGLGVLLATVPFHHGWVQLSGGAPPIVAGFAGSVGMAAGVAALLRLTVGGMGPSLHVWIDVMAVIGALTVAYAAVMSLRPGGPRRLLAYLVLAQSGVMLAGPLSLSQGDDQRAGIVALLVYLATATVSALAAFGALDLLEHAGVRLTLDAYRGAGHRWGPAVHCLAAAIAGLAGLPPLAVFVARSLLVQSAVMAGYAWVAVVTVIGSALLAVAAIRFIGVLYAAPADEAPHERPPVPRVAMASVAACAVAAVLLGALAQPLLAISSGAAGTLVFR